MVSNQFSKLSQVKIYYSIYRRLVPWVNFFTLYHCIKPKPATSYLIKLWTLIFRLCNRGQLPLHGKFIRASVYGYSPYLDLNTVTNEGVLIDYFDILSEFLQFDYEIVMSHSWFDFFANGSIGGSLGDVKTDIDFILLR